MVNPMSQKWRKYSPEFRRDVLEKMKTCPNISALARELGVRRKWLYAWKKRALGGQQEQTPAEAPNPAATAALRKRVAELEALTARQGLELDFFTGALQRIEERRRKRESTSAPGSTSKSGS
jgi:transposase-like protein